MLPSSEMFLLMEKIRATGMNPRPGRSILLQAYDGSPIANSIDADPTDQLVELAKQESRVRLILASVRPLGPPTGRYNCHGLVFASRRTNIPPPAHPIWWTLTSSCIGINRNGISLKLSSRYCSGSWPTQHRPLSMNCLLISPSSKLQQRLG